LKSKTTTTKKIAKKRILRSSKKELNPAGVRKDIAQMVESEATTMAQAVIDEGKKGQLATVKYLFEMAEIYPLSTDGSHATENEDCLAQTLLHRLDIPDEPIARDEEDAPKAVTRAVKVVVKAAATTESEAEGKDSGADPKTDNDKQVSVAV